MSMQLTFLLGEVELVSVIILLFCPGVTCIKTICYPQGTDTWLLKEYIKCTVWHQWGCAEFKITVELVFGA